MQRHNQTTQDTQYFSTVQRAFALLRCFSIKDRELSVTELSRRLGVHKSTVSRLLTALSADRIVERNPETGKYRLGIGLLELAGLVQLHSDLRQIARPYLRQLSDTTLETVNLAILDGDHSVNLEQAVSYDRMISGAGWVGRRAPLHASSTGKTFLAFLPEERLATVLSSDLPRYTEHTITDAAGLRQELLTIRQQQYACTLQELELGLNSVAAIVRDHHGAVVAALSVTGPSARLTRQHIQHAVAAQVVSCAQQISKALGFTG